MPVVVAVPKFFDRILEPFAEVLSKPQFRQFRRYVLGLILCLEARNIEDISETLRGTDQSNLNRFVTRPRWKPRELQGRVRKLGFEQVKTGSPLYLCLDDTLCAKTGRRMEGAGWQYCAMNGRQTWGHNLLYGFVVHPDGGFPSDVALYRKKEDCRARGIPFRTKIELAREMVGGFLPPASHAVTVLGDAWFFCRDLVVDAEAKGYHWIFASKGNRVVYRRGHKTKLSRLAKREKLSDYKRVKIRGRVFWVLGLEVEIPKIGKVLLVLNREKTKGKKRLGCPRLVVTDRLDLPPEKVLELYLNRFQIEVFFRDAKGHLGLDQYQMRRADGVLTHASLVSAAYLFLARLNARLPKRHRKQSVGELAAWVQRRVYQESLLWAHRQGLHHRTKNVIYQK
ncbi:MAG: IS701 family transposase, partial [candidate division Zixibacteria bacterium]|nr:IS701 family transposase [candidate division Zixibacteria bacterium]